MDDADALGYGTAIGAVGLAEGVANCKHDIGLAIDLQGGAGGITATGINTAAERKRMVFREDSLAHNGGCNRHGQEFCQFHDFVGGAGAHGSTTGVEDGQPSVHEQIGGALDIGVRRAGFARCSHRGICQHVVIGLGHQHVLVHLQNHRPGGTRAQGGERTSHHLGDILDPG